MGKQIKLPSNRLSEHATDISKHSAELKLTLSSPLSYSTGSAQSLQYSLTEISEGLTGFQNAIQKEAKNLKEIERAMEENEHKLAKMIASTLKQVGEHL
ncbi:MULTISPECIES: DUF3130 family protein [Listeria]|uniref:DUF3130 family protein n=1 Tax=Listeria TaxID=1637 RepID=UPI000B596E3C|nr:MULTISPECIES: DUF3130 family protein [Listeria]